MVELTVDNFLTKKILNDFNAQEAKSLEMRLFIDFCTVLDLSAHRENVYFRWITFKRNFSSMISTLKTLRSRQMLVFGNCEFLVTMELGDDLF